MYSKIWEVLIAFTLVGAVIGLAIRLLLPRVLAWRGVWFTWHTRFGPALVFDSQDADGTTVRLFNVGGTFQSICYVDEDLLWDPTCEYHRSWAMLVHKTWPLRRKGPGNAEPMRQGNDLLSTRRALIMGGGGYSFPKWLVAYRPDFTCDAVEIDPAVLAIARERLFLGRLENDFRTQETGRLHTPICDAWEYLRSDTEGYDLIVNDVFARNKPLGTMQTIEGARMVKAHLRPGGRYIGNMRTSLEGRDAQVLHSTAQAFQEVFDHVEIIPERPEEPRKKGNNALVAWDNKTMEGEDDGRRNERDQLG